MDSREARFSISSADASVKGKPQRNKSNAQKHVAVPFYGTHTTLSLLLKKA